MQRKFFVFVLVILSLFLPGTVLANTQNVNAWNKSRLAAVLLNDATDNRSQISESADEPTDDLADSDPEIEDPTVPELQLPIEAARIEQIFLPLVMNPRQASAAGPEAAPAADSTAAESMHSMHSMASDSPISASATTGFGTFDKNSLPVEMQSWWTPAFGHIHLAAFVPLGQSVKGTINLPIRIVMHDNPSVLRYVSIHSDQKPLLRVALGNLRCPQPVCAWAVNVPLDTTKMTSGWRELRLRAETVTPDGKQYLNSSGIPILVQNGSASNNYNRFCNNTSLIGRGWYTGFGYTNAVIECVPTASVRGQVTFRVKAQSPSSHLTVELDKSHFIPAVGAWPAQADSAGAILWDKAGSFTSWIPITIDTTKLANGWHGLAVKSTGSKGEVSKCSGCPTDTNLPAGVAKIWFNVQN